MQWCDDEAAGLSGGGGEWAEDVRPDAGDRGAGQVQGRQEGERETRSDLSSDVDDECLVSVFSGRRGTPASPVSRRSQVRLDVIVSIAARDSPKDSASGVHTNAHVGL